MNVKKHIAAAPSQTLFSESPPRRFGTLYRIAGAMGFVPDSYG
jgi:hypothetical protein